jgi:hypothetical protein
MKQSLIAVIAFTSLLLSFSAADAQQKDWKFEFVPYLWLAGIDADVSVGPREGSVDVGFDDLKDALEFGGSFLSVVQYKQIVAYAQVDYLSLDTNELDNASSGRRFENESLFAAGALGYQFRTFGEKSTIDVLGGLRYLDLQNTFTGGARSGDGELQILDAIIMLRPSLQLLDRLRFNPALSIGAGDSDLTYEMQPQFEFQVTEILVARAGYRKLYYDVSGDRASFDGSFQGLIAGFGFAF